ncbi:MAG TPA: YlmC/YmxH family sporulation protein [Bacillales bacterium]|nr:YlmC/YmxH family sporulation protein [Bacillales bacterium]
MSRISEFQAKDVVNVSDGKVLGHIGDLEINTNTGKIDSLIIPGNGRMMGLFGRESDVVISWKNIVRIGTDVILVRFRDAEVNGSQNYEGDYKKDS